MPCATLPARADLLSSFVRDSLDPAQFAREVVRRDARGADEDGDVGMGVGGESQTEATLHRLAARLRGLDVAVRALVGEHQGELLTQASQTAELKLAVDAIVTRVAKVCGRVWDWSLTVTSWRAGGG